MGVGVGVCVWGGGVWRDWTLPSSVSKKLLSKVAITVSCVGTGDFLEECPESF